MNNSNTMATTTISAAIINATTCTPATLTHGWIIICCVSISFMLFRMSIDLVQMASKKTEVDFKESHHNNATANKNNTDKNKTTAAAAAAAKTKKKGQVSSSTATTKMMELNDSNQNYGSITKDDNGGKKEVPEEEEEEEEDVTELYADELEEAAGGSEVDNLLQRTEEVLAQHLLLESNSNGTWSFRLQCILLIVLLVAALLHGGESCVLAVGLVRTCVVVVSFGAILTYRDVDRKRFGYISRAAYLASALTLSISISVTYYKQRDITISGDEFVVNVMGLYALLAIGECFFVSSYSLPVKFSENGDIIPPPPSQNKNNIGLSTEAILTLLKPYVWPDETADSALMNRARVIMTWVCVILSKSCNLTAPILLGKASTALAHQQYTNCIYLSVGYATIQFFGSMFKEGQSLVYLRVAQAAFVQLSETTFSHLHRLSLDWHLRKKLGEVMISLDRGIAACDTLMKYLFLWLIPALAECLVVCIMFATYYSYAPLAIVVFYSVWLYIVWTIIITLQRKKFRKAVVKSDNEWHDRATDSLMNFETVKYFTGEEYERERFRDCISRYQAGSVNVQASLSFLNITQKLILQVCLAMALGLSSMGISQRSDCCVDQGCSSGISDCCQAIDKATCPGMEVGDFVAVLSFTMQLFQPLNFLGSVYNAIVMAIVDLTNLSQLLAQSPDVIDAPDAMVLPRTNEDEDDIAVEFDNVFFHYPTQPASKGLKGVSFKMRRGTTTAIVGPTGAGKTTISRLFFRFYDVLGGAVKINGKDVRTVTQKTLRGSIGVVPQAASMFNDTIRENIRYGRRNGTQEDLNNAARDAQLLGFVESLDDGWDSVVGDRGLKLSGGERQRAAIARCLMKDPPLVLLDEATSALDTITENSVQEALDRLGSNRTVLVIAHRLGTVRNADNIIVLKAGLVAEEGTHDELLEKGGVYASMWNMQLHSTSNAGSQVSLDTVNSEN